VHRICWSALTWDSEFRNLLLRGISRGVGRNGRSRTLGVDVMLVRLRRMVVESFDDFIGIDLAIGMSNATESGAEKDQLHWQLT